MKKLLINCLENRLNCRKKMEEYYRKKETNKELIESNKTLFLLFSKKIRQINHTGQSTDSSYPLMN